MSSYLYKLTPGTTGPLALAGGATEVDATKLFNTNVPFGMAMVIRRVHCKWFRTVVDLTTAHANEALMVAQLSEAVGSTKPNAADNLALWTDETINAHHFLTSGVFNNRYEGWTRYDYLPPHPGVPTMAQQLILLASATSIDDSHNTSDTWNLSTEIYYELINLNQQLKDYLANRISVQRTT